MSFRRESRISEIGYIQLHQIKPRGGRDPSAFCFRVKISWLLRRMSVNLPDAIQMKHVITFGACYKGTVVRVLPGTSETSDDGIFGLSRNCAGQLRARKRPSS